MKLKALALGLFLLGVSTSDALASGPPAGKGKYAATTSGSMTGSTTTTTSGSKQEKDTLCQPTGSKTHPYSKITVAAASVPAHVKKGDIRPDANGNCPTTATSTTTGATTTSTTTTTTSH